MNRESNQPPVTFDPFAGANIVSTAHCTESQKEIWLSAQLGDDASCAFNESVSLELTGPLNVEALERAITIVVARHDALRGSFSRSGEHMCIAAEAAVELRIEDLAGMTSEQRESRRDEVLAEEVKTAFDLERGPLVRFRLLPMTADEHWLVVTAHHIVCDGWSMAVLLQDLAAIYTGLCEGREPTLPPVESFSTYTRLVEEYDASEQAAADERYWLEQYRDGVPVLELPTDHARPAIKTFASDRYDYELDAEVVAGLKRTGARAGCSTFATLLAGFQAFLARLSGQGEMVVGVPAAGQSAFGQEQLVGHCVNTLPIHGRVDLEQGFVETLRQTRSQVLDAFEHQRYTFGTLVRKLGLPRDPSRLPLVNVLFNYDRAIEGGKLGFAGLQAEFFSNPRRYENFEWFVNASEADGRLVLECQYNADLYDRETICRYLASFETLLRSAVASPERPLAQLSILSPAQLQQLAAWNATERDYPTDVALSDLIRQQAQRTPDATAVVCGEQSLTYRELDERANRLAHYLAEQGAEPGALIGLCVERSVEMVVAMLAILKAGAAYVPLDPNYPAQRLAYMCRQSQLKMLITESALRDSWADFELPLVCLDSEAESIARQASTPPRIAIAPHDLAYVIYTSGSTGQPKGVQVPHGPVVNFLLSMGETPGLDAQDVVFALTTLSFDIHVLEIFLPLVCGATCVVIERAVAEDGRSLAAAVERYQPTLLQATPATWRLLCDSAWRGSPKLKALCGGEPLPADLVEPLLARCGSLWNMYGPTETTVWSTCLQIVDPHAPILIGRPIANTQIHLLDERRQATPIGVPGEVYIGGAGVTLGYIHQPELTDERFVVNPYHDPFSSYVNVKLYRTGDLARYRADGNIEFLRRVDKQVKVRGYRIELGEIEQALGRHPGVRQGVVTVREDRPDDTRLVAYVVPHAEQRATSSELRKHLRDTLPAYMIPQHFVELDTLPQTNNGKIDYKALPPVGGRSERTDELVPPTTLNECLVAEVWCQALGLTQVGRHDNFFHLGGHSLLAMKTIGEIERKTGYRMSPRDLLAGTLEQVAAQLPDQMVDPQPAEIAASKALGRLEKLKNRLFK